MTVQVSDLIADTRVLSGLRGNPLFSNDQIAELLTDAYQQFRDKVNSKFAFWFSKELQFTLAGGQDGNKVVLSTDAPDFLQAQYLNRDLGGGIFETVTTLESIAQRNVFLGAGFNSIGFGGRGRRYFIDGDTLELLPWQLAAGNYTLRYTPMDEALSTLETRSWAITADDVPLTDSFGSGFNFVNANFDALRDVGATFTVTFDAPNASFSGTYTITGIHPGSSTWCFVEGGVSPIGFTSPAAGPDVVETYQPPGTRATLPVQLTPWALYLKLHAAIAIRSSQKQETSDLERRFGLQEQRVATAMKTRTQGVVQAPITRGRRGLYNGGNSGGW